MGQDNQHRQTPPGILDLASRVTQARTRQEQTEPTAQIERPTEVSITFRVLGRHPVLMPDGTKGVKYIFGAFAPNPDNEGELAALIDNTNGVNNHVIVISESIPIEAPSKVIKPPSNILLH